MKKSLLLIACLLSFPFAGVARECSPYTNYFYVHCALGICKDGFRAWETPQRRCARKLTVDAIAPEQMPELIGQIQKSAASESESLNGIFQISLTGFGMFDANAIKKARKQSGESRNDLRIQIWKMDPATDLQALKNEWLDRANRSPKSTMMFWLQSFVALIFALGLMGAIYKGYKGYKAYSAYNCRGE